MDYGDKIYDFTLGYLGAQELVFERLESDSKISESTSNFILEQTLESLLKNNNLRAFESYLDEEKGVQETKYYVKEFGCLIDSVENIGEKETVVKRDYSQVDGNFCLLGNERKKGKKDEGNKEFKVKLEAKEKKSFCFKYRDFDKYEISSFNVASARLNLKKKFLCVFCGLDIMDSNKIEEKIGTYWCFFIYIRNFNLK